MNEPLHTSTHCLFFFFLHKTHAFQNCLWKNQIRLIIGLVAIVFCVLASSKTYLNHLELILNYIILNMCLFILIEVTLHRHIIRLSLNNAIIQDNPWIEENTNEELIDDIHLQTMTGQLNHLRHHIPRRVNEQYCNEITICNQ